MPSVLIGAAVVPLAKPGVAIEVLTLLKPFTGSAALAQGFLLPRMDIIEGAASLARVANGCSDVLDGCFVEIDQPTHGMAGLFEQPMRLVMRKPTLSHFLKNPFRIEAISVDS